MSKPEVKRSDKTQKKASKIRRLDKKWLWLFGGLIVAIGILLATMWLSSDVRQKNSVAKGLVGAWRCDGDVGLTFYKDKSFYWKVNGSEEKKVGTYTNAIDSVEFLEDIRGEKGGDMYKYSVVFEENDRIMLTGSGLGNRKESFICNREI